MTAIMLFASHEDGGWPRPVRALVLARAVNQLGAFAMSFLAVALVDVYGASLVTAGWVVALFGLATVPSRLAGGRMADRLGRRSTIVLGLLGCSASLLVIAVSPGVGGAAVGAALLGLAFEIYEPPSQALLAEMVAPERRPQAFGLLGAALAAAGVGAGIIAVLLGGVSLRLLFVADSVTCVAAAALILMWVQEPSTARPAASDGNPWRDGRLLVMLGVGTGVAFAWNFSVTALPLTVAARGLGPAETGWLLAVAAAVTIADQRFLRGAAARPFFLMTAGLIVVAAGFAVVAFADVIALLCLGAATVALGQVFLLGPPVRRCSRSRGRRLPRGAPGGVRHLLGHRPDPRAACLDSPAVHRGARGLAHRRRPVRPAGRARAIRRQGRDSGWARPPSTS